MERSASTIGELPSPRLWCSSVVFKGLNPSDASDIASDKMFIYGGHVTQGQANLIGTVKNDLYEYDFSITLHAC